MTVAPALADDIAAGSEIVPLADLQTAFELVVELERSGAMTSTALQLPDVDWDTYESLGFFLGRVNRSCSWWIGDWLVYGQASFAERFSQAAGITGLSEQTLLGRMFVSENVPPARRIEGVAFSCHAAVARLQAAEQTRWLKAAKKGGWSYAELKERMKAARKDSKPQIPGTEGDEGEPDTEMLIEVANAILRDMVEHEDGQHFVIPKEDVERLRAALGRE